MSKLFDFSSFLENIAVVTDRGESLSYKRLDEHCNLLASYLEKGNLAFCFCDNVLGSLIGYVTFIKEGIPVVMIDGSKDLEMLSNFASIYKPNYIWLPKKRLEEFGNYQLKCIMFDYALVSFSKEKHEFCNELALLLTTSGSTGSPKLVKLTLKNVQSNAESIAEYLHIDDNERPITSMPMHYSYGLSVINSHLLKGATILLTDKAVVQKEFWQFAKEQKATSISGVPYTYEMLQKLRIFNMNLPSLKTLTQAGGKLNADLAKEYIEKANVSRKQFIIMYGQTEATARMSYLPWNFASIKYSSIGIAIPKGKFSLIDEKGDEITTPNKDGELIYEGPNVSLGYAESIEDLAKGDDNHGVLHTGDVARRDEDGIYYITGRLKRFVKVYGNRCNLDSLEQLIKSCVDTNCACSGVDDKVTVFVTQKGLEKQIIDILSHKTGLNSRAFEVKVIQSIPKNSSGKIQYSELQKILD